MPVQTAPDLSDAPDATSEGALLTVSELTVSFAGQPVVDGITYALSPGRTLGVVGESGCGKSMTALAILGLVPPPGRIAGGSVRLGQDVLTALPARRLREIRGRRIGMIFQEPMTSAEPVFHRIGVPDRRRR